LNSQRAHDTPPGVRRAREAADRVRGIGIVRAPWSDESLLAKDSFLLDLAEDGSDHRLG
jgi:hypothetical protein